MKLGSLLHATFNLKHWGKTSKNSFKNWHPIFCKSTSNVWVQQIRIFNNRVSVSNVLHIRTFHDVTQLSSPFDTLRSWSGWENLQADKRRSGLRIRSSLHHVSTTSALLTCAGLSTLNLRVVNDRNCIQNLSLFLYYFSTRDVMWVSAETKVRLQHTLQPV